MLSRVAFAQGELSARRPWTGVMFTDSKYFHMSPPKGNKIGKAWVRKGSIREVRSLRAPAAIHAYAGVTKYGCTKLHFVTGTVGMHSNFVDPRTRRSYRGVSGPEYQQVLADTFIPEGDRLFAGSMWAGRWVLQQDGAPCHRCSSTLKRLHDLLPGRLLLRWPANSPDLSPIDHVWAWADARLKRLPVPQNVEGFMQQLQDVWQQVPPRMCVNLHRGMCDRMHRCVAANGARIGK